MFKLQELENLKQNLTIEEVLELLYTLVVLKKLSAIPHTRINLFNEKSIRFEDLKSQLKEVKNIYDVTEILDGLEKIENVKDDLFIELFNISQNVEIPSIYEAFEYREGLHTSVVSKQIVELSIKLLDEENESPIYVPFKDGLKVSELTTRKVCCEYDDSKKSFVASLLRLWDNKKIDFRLTDSLEKPKFSQENSLEKFDSVIAFPPLSLMKQFDTMGDKFNRFKIHKNVKRLDVAHFEHVISQTKNKAVILMPVGFTFRSGIEEEFRKYLIENNILETMIQLPPNMYSATSIETTLFIINKNKNNKNIQFINLKDEKFLTKIGRKTVLKDINEIVKIYLEKKVESHSRIISYEVIKNNNFNFSIDRYITKNESIPSSFKWIKLENVSIIRKSQTLKDVDDGENVVELSPSDFSFAGYTISGKKIKKININEKQFETYKLKPYDILVSAKGVVGKIGIVGENINYLLASQAIQVIRLEKDNDIKSEAICLYMYLKSDIGQKALMKIVQGTAMPQISTKELKNFNIPKLSVLEKSNVINTFNKEIEKYDEIAKLQNDILKIHANYLK
ncbi:N-6 DNA methylase [Arcobacter sp. F2176]|uniref:N-6 DNA methylase n=1 Tax=Arcobacter sp. F2176 TaxID=2044511 RepID=UPI00100B66DC|nr:N-6 DNA methylase [Arcobacter sp. F2176]RXJ81065.1 hypothetical protein CRU95_09110 [Arcobacter sp. F2176]